MSFIDLNQVALEAREHILSKVKEKIRLMLEARKHFFYEAAVEGYLGSYFESMSEVLSKNEYDVLSSSASEESPIVIRLEGMSSAKVWLDEEEDELIIEF